MLHSKVFGNFPQEVQLSAPDLVGLVLQLVGVHLTKGQGLDADGEGDL